MTMHLDASMTLQKTALCGGGGAPGSDARGIGTRLDSRRSGLGNREEERDGPGSLVTGDYVGADTCAQLNTSTNR